MPDNDVVMLFFPLAIMEPIRGLKPDVTACKWMRNKTWIPVCNNYRISSFFFRLDAGFNHLQSSSPMCRHIYSNLCASPIQYLSKGNHILLLM